jgi:SAM-dependent methyltransferase
MRDWNGTAEAYDRSFATLCDGTVERMLADLPGGDLLDVGCGTGRLAEAAEANGRQVTAVDADPSMLAVARRRLRGTVLRAALPELPVEEGSAEAIAANFVVNHVGRPRAAVRELRRVLRPGGCLAMTIWPADGAVWSALLADVFDEAGAVPQPPDHLPEHEDFERSAAGLAGVVREASLDVLSACDLDWEWRIRPSDLWAGVEAGIAGPGAVYRAQSAPVQASIRAVFEACTGALVGDDGLLRFPVRAAYVLAE